MKNIVLFICLIWPLGAVAQDRNFTLSAPEQIVETGFLQYLLPRFALKYGVRITQVPADGDVMIGADGVPVFAGQGQVWHLSHNGAAGAVKFEEWLLSEIGKRTVAAFKIAGNAPFTADFAVQAVVPVVVFEGDVVLGESLAFQHCGRCHVINHTNRMKGMGQTPSFGLLRTFDDWQNRFATFYALNPHPSFTQVADITPPFDIRRPPAIVPLDITQDELDAILAYVATIEPADLGAPLQSQ